jgi:hypothetical protein
VKVGDLVRYIPHGDYWLPGLVFKTRRGAGKSWREAWTHIVHVRWHDGTELAEGIEQFEVVSAVR